MQITETRKNEVLVLDLAGKVDVNSSKIFQDKFTEVAGRNEKFIILDCQNLSYVSSSGLRVFLMFLKHVNKLGGKLVISGMSELIYEVFEISGFVPIFTIVGNLDEAYTQF